MDNAIATILEWPNVLRWSSFENLIDYVVFQDRMIPFIDFEIIQGKIPEEYYMDYFDAYQNYMMLLSKEEKNLDDFYRIYDIVFYFYARLGLTPEDISFSTASYPTLDFDLLSEHLIDEDGFSTSIYYQDGENDLSKISAEMKIDIKNNFTTIKENIEDYLLEFGSPYGIQGQDITPNDFLNYLVSLGFTLE